LFLKHDSELIPNHHSNLIPTQASIKLTQHSNLIPKPDSNLIHREHMDWNTHLINLDVIWSLVRMHTDSNTPDYKCTNTPDDKHTQLQMHKHTRLQHNRITTDSNTSKHTRSKHIQFQNLIQISFTGCTRPQTHPIKPNSRRLLLRVHTDSINPITTAKMRTRH